MARIPANLSVDRNRMRGNRAAVGHEARRLPDIYPEGERIPRDKITDVFRQPPGLPPIFDRSGLVVGSRGVGKTTLLRYQKEVHNGVAIHLSFNAVVAPISQETSLGPLSPFVPDAQESAIVGKSEALLAVRLCEKLLKRGLLIPDEVLVPCVPRHLRTPEMLQTMTDLQALIERVAQAPLSAGFDEIALSHPLEFFLTTLADLAAEQQGELLLMIDKADMVPAVTLIPIIELLNQPRGYLLLIAIRPGVSGSSALVEVSNRVVAGDHYDVWTLGLYSGSKAWGEFLLEAATAQFGKWVDEIPSHIQELVRDVSGESVKTAIKLFLAYLHAPINKREAAITQELERLREQQVMATAKTVKEFVPSFDGLIKMIRSKARKQNPGIKSPVLITLTTTQPLNLFGTPTNLDLFVERSLRLGGLSLREGSGWAPGDRPVDFEIPALLTWESQDGLRFQRSDSSIRPVKLKADDVLQKPMKPPKWKVFVAFRMDIAESQKFRFDIEDAIHSHRQMSDVEIVDGRALVGDDWASLIRRRMRGVRAVIADITGARRDVLFEAGFAYGLGKPLLQVVATNQDRQALPGWMTAPQMGHFATQPGLEFIVSSLFAHLRKLATPPTKSPKPVPGLAVWAGRAPWAPLAQDQFTSVCESEGIDSRLIPSEDELESGENLFRRSLVEEASKANLLVATLDGTQRDHFVHFVAGAIVANPTAPDSHGLERQILIVEDPNQSRRRSLAADSLKRCEETVKIIPANAVRSAIQEFAQSHRSWALGES